MVNDLPYNQEAEQAVLGSILIDGNSIHEVRNDLKDEHFYIPEHQYTYKACISLNDRGEAIDQITVSKELKSQGKLEEVTVSYLSKLIASTPTSLHIRYYANIVRSSYVQRLGVKIASNIAEVSYREVDTTKLISEAEKQFLTLQKTVNLPHLLTPKDLANIATSRYMDAGIKQASKPSGFHNLDLVTGGLFPGEYRIIGGRPGIGKTTLMWEMAQSVAKNDNTLFCSLEMPWGDIMDRVAATKCNTSPIAIRSGKWSEKEEKGIIEAIGEVSESNMYFISKSSSGQEFGITTGLLYSMAIHMKLSYGLSAIFVDYIQLFADEYGRSPYERIGYISSRLKNMAQSLEVPIVCACQLTRHLEQQLDKRPALHDLRDSGRLEEDADVVIFIYRDDYYGDLKNEETIGKAELIIAKQRQGEANISIPLIWNGRKRCYEERTERNVD